MTILVTGSAGHLGEALVRSLRAQGRAARGIDLKPSPFTERVGSIRDRRFVADCMQEVHAVIHSATLHKPHVATHSAQDFVDANVTGTLVLLEAAVSARVESFVYISTTSAFGAALLPPASGTAIWVNEALASAPKNIYGATKVMAEDLCELMHRQHRLPVVVLRTSRFFPEDDDNPEVRANFTRDNVQVNELLYRRVDIADAASAALRALERAPAIGFARYIVSASSPFRQDDLPMLAQDAATVVRRLFPQFEALYAARSWKLFPRIDRVYVNDRARAELGWVPMYDFATALRCLHSGEDFRSPLARDVGTKGYHDRRFADGPYPLA